MVENWPSGATLFRGHPLARGPLEPNPTPSPGRFRPVHDAGGDVVPSCYAADSVGAAIAEGPFHDLPLTSGPKLLARAITDTLALTPLVCERELALVSLRGHGPRRLGETQGSLIEPGPQCYPASAAWGQAAYDHDPEIAGILWVSRQFPGGASMVLFWDRCGTDFREQGPTLPLATGRGFQLLAEAANAAGVVIAEA